MTNGAHGTSGALFDLVSFIAVGVGTRVNVSCYTGTTMFRRLDEAVLQARRQRAVHDEFTKTFRRQVIARWSQEVDTWCDDPHNDAIVNPFAEPEPDVTMADVRRELNAEETADGTNGVVQEHTVSASKYLVAGLHLEDQQ